MSDEAPSNALAQHRLGGPQATVVAATEYRRFAAVLDALTTADWSRPTACPPWDVRRLTAHVLGATEANGSLAEMLHQLRRGRRGATVEVDVVSGVQVRERQDLDPGELRRRFRRAVPTAVRGRARWSRLAGAVRMRVGEPVHETWPLRRERPLVGSR